MNESDRFDRPVASTKMRLAVLQRRRILRIIWARRPVSVDKKATTRLDPKVDIVFRAIFGKPGNADILMSLLNGILDLSGDDRITEVQVLNPLSDIESTDDKSFVMDLFVQDASGHRYGVEMQCRNHKAFPERMLYYATRRYAEQVGTAAAYTTLKPLVLVVFTDFDLFPRVASWRERFELRGGASDVVFSRHLSIVVVELPKFRKAIAEVSNPGETWVMFLKEGTKMEPDMTNAPWSTPELRKAVEELKRMEGDQSMREVFHARLDQLRVLATEYQDHYEQGLEKGLEKGRSLARRELARELLAEGESVERVARLTGLSVEELQAIPQS